MVRFTDRDAFLSWVKFHVRRRSIIRAMNEGKVEHLGGFTYLPILHDAGWVCRVTSTYGRTWIIAGTSMSKITILQAVPWRFWAGNKAINPLYSGDNPEEYKKIRHRLYFKENYKQISTQNRAGHSCQEDTNNEYTAKQRKKYSVFSRILRYFRR